MGHSARPSDAAGGQWWALACKAATEGRNVAEAKKLGNRGFPERNPVANIYTVEHFALAARFGSAVLQLIAGVTLEDGK